MSLLAYILFAIVIYRQASGKIHYSKWVTVPMYILTLGTILVVAYIGYRHNPDRNNLSFGEVL